MPYVWGTGYARTHRATFLQDYSKIVINIVVNKKNALHTAIRPEQYEKKNVMCPKGTYEKHQHDRALDTYIDKHLG